MAKKPAQPKPATPTPKPTVTTAFSKIARPQRFSGIF
jgi:hypothetical protein